MFRYQKATKIARRTRARAVSAPCLGEERYNRDPEARTPLSPVEELAESDVFVDGPSGHVTASRGPQTESTYM